MVKTAEVFTPSKTPTHTSVTRKELWAKVEGLAEQGGAFISVMGTTKLGKSTLVKSVMQTAAFHAYIPGQTVTEGAGALWSRLASDLGIPASTTSGTVSGDKSKWGFFGRFGISVPGFTGGGGSSVGGEHSIDKSKGATYEMDAPSAVTEALTLLAQDAREKNSQPPIIVIDDFHFVMKPEKRRELIRLFGHSVGVRLAGWGSAGRGRGPRGSVAPTAAPTEDLDVSHDSSGCADACSAACPCSRCDLLLGLDGVHVEDVDRRDGLLIVTVSSPAAPTGCPSCGVVADGFTVRDDASAGGRTLGFDDPWTNRIRATAS